jgi:hypothetical protein
MTSCTLFKIVPNMNLALILNSFTIFSELSMNSELKKLMVESLGGISFPSCFPRGDAG